MSPGPRDTFAMHTSSYPLPPPWVPRPELHQALGGKVERVVITRQVCAV